MSSWCATSYHSLTLNLNVVYIGLPLGHAKSASTKMMPVGYSSKGTLLQGDGHPDMITFIDKMGQERPHFIMTASSFNVGHMCNHFF